MAAGKLGLLFKEKQPAAGTQTSASFFSIRRLLLLLLSLSHTQSILGAGAMDATPLSEKAPPAADAVPSAARHAVDQSPSSSPESAATAGEDDDEQVERFYALLDNIRDMRGMVSTGGAAAAGRKKRARDAEPPWRPAFRMEDFELELEVDSDSDSDSVGCADEKKKKKQKRDSSAKRPVDDEEQEQGEVVEEATTGRRRREQPPPQSHKARRAGVLAVVDT